VPGRSKSEPALKQACKNESMHVASKPSPLQRAPARRSWLNAQREPCAAEPAVQWPQPVPQMSLPQMSCPLNTAQAGQWAAHFGAFMASAFLGGEIPHPHPLNAYIVKHICEKPRKRDKVLSDLEFRNLDFRLLLFKILKIRKSRI
jgi:hypothetical protein